MKTIECSIRDVKTGENVKIITPSNIYQCRLDDDVFVGPFVEIQKGCVIGRGSRIQSHSFLCENVTVGENCFIGHNVTFANDLFRSGAPDPDTSSWITITLGDNVTIGSGATVLTTSICSGAVIGAGSVVIRPVTVKGIYAGNPARLIRKLP
ncbi:acyltransferase [Erwinia sp. S38]|uniref:acyltransferase n=1 Tax=Erwinia sp. S38 TaxID=2769338 RepID=UPI00190AEE0F|nr:acyltransferase [Erwinia sp. S38]MBK0002644.1 N-acetyltransferase [Erwinia sp. S38]